MNKTPEEVFNYIVRNSHYYRPTAKTVEEKQEQFKECGRCFNKEYWASVESYVPCFHVPLNALESFLSDNYDFLKYMDPLEKQGLITMTHYCHDCFPHSTELRKAQLKQHGLVKDYKTGEMWFTYYLGKVNPNTNKVIYPWI